MDWVLINSGLYTAQLHCSVGRKNGRRRSSVIIVQRLSVEQTPLAAAFRQQLQVAIAWVDLQGGREAGQHRREWK